MTENHCLYYTNPTISDFIATVSVSSHPLFSWYHTNCIYEISSARHHLHCIRHDSHWFCVITPIGSMIAHFCMDDMTHTICITSYTLHKSSHTHFMTSHALYSWNHSHYIWHCIHSICVITPTLLMISDQLYLWHHKHFMYDILCTIHNVTSTLNDFTPL